MDRVILTIIIGITVTLGLAIIPVISYWLIAEGQYITMVENNTLPQKSTKKMIIRDNIVTVINTTTNETISVRNLTENAGNATTNQTLTTNGGNATTNQTLTTNGGNATTNQTLTTNGGNAT